MEKNKNHIISLICGLEKRKKTTNKQKSKKKNPNWCRQQYVSTRREGGLEVQEGEGDK